MCGIAGTFTTEGGHVGDGVLDRMTEALRSRGPDDMRTWTHGRVGLGHTRLSIIDLEGGAQPMVSAAGNAVVFNGEIYNYLELREQLGGYGFRTHSDTEVILALYETRGTEGLDDLRGMFAFAIYDTTRNTLILKRDDFGIKPLYYLQTDGVFAFASSPRSFLDAGLCPPTVDPGLAEQWVGRGYTYGDKTLLSPICRFLPGEMLTVQGGRLTGRQRRPTLAAPKRSDKTMEAALGDLDGKLSESVRLHCRADVPYGLFLSGGVDSSAILIALSKLSSDSAKTFTIGFDTPGGRDEMAKAAVLAGKFGADHTELVFGEADFWSCLPKIAGYFDDPLADYAVLPTWKLAAEAARHLKVVLCGEGGDETFAGYGRYKNRPIQTLLRQLRRKPRNTLSDAEALEQFRLFEGGGGYSPLQVKQIRDIVDYLPNDLLLKLDNCLMAHGLEGRTPLLDKEIMAFSFSLPDRLKMANGTGKLLLKTWVDRHAPEALAFGRKKGFTVPVGYWISKRAGDIADLLVRSEAIRKYAGDLDLHALFANSAKANAHLCWRLMYFAAWHQLHVEAPGAGADFQGDFFDLFSAPVY